MVMVKLFSKNENLSLLNTTGKDFAGILKETANDAVTFEVCKIPDKQTTKSNKQKNKKNNIINSEQKNTDDINNIIILAKKDIAHIYAYDEIGI